jgi:hypothetical protein
MKRRDLLRVAAAAPLLAARGAPGQDGGAGAPAWPGEEKLTRAKREIYQAMSRVSLANGDAPDLLPRPPLRRRR